jgi:hypothetical protein
MTQRKWPHNFVQRGARGPIDVVMKFDEAGRLTFNGKEIGTVKLMMRP